MDKRKTGDERSESRLVLLQRLTFRIADANRREAEAIHLNQDYNERMKRKGEPKARPSFFCNASPSGSAYMYRPNLSQPQRRGRQ